MSEPQIIGRKRYSGQTLYEFCPFCVYECKSSKIDYRASLQPMWLIKTIEKVITKDAEGKEDVKAIFDSYCYCDKCKRRITADTMLYWYGANSQGIPNRKK